MSRRARRWGPLAALVAAACAGCSSIGGIAGAVAGTATGTFSTNPAVGIAVGVSVKAATDATMRRVFRAMQADEQARIAQVAGGLDAGGRQAWQVHHFLSFGDEAGELQVLGGIDNVLAECKEVLFSVSGGTKTAPTREWFITQVCRQSDGQWRWAASDPSTGRWGTLQ